VSWDQWCNDACTSEGPNGESPEWGDQGTLFGVSAAYGVMINVVSDVCSTEWLTYARHEYREYPEDKILYIGFSKKNLHYWGTTILTEATTVDKDRTHGPSQPDTADYLDDSAQTELDNCDMQADSGDEHHDDGDVDEVDSTSDCDDAASKRSDETDSSSNKLVNKLTALCQIILIDAILTESVQEVATLLKIDLDLNKVKDRDTFTWDDVFALVIRRIALIEDLKRNVLPGANSIKHLQGLPADLTRPVSTVNGTYARLPSLLLAN
jgi:hypothetical protein